MPILKAVDGQKPREIATRVLARRGAGGEFVEALLDHALAQSRLSGADRGLCYELTLGAVRWQATLDWLIARKAPGRTQKAGLQNLLRLGLYQIFWLDRIPPHAAVHETVELARQSGFGAQAGFVNAVLRGYLREADTTRALLAGLKTSQPALGWSHPEWLVERWRQRWGDEPTRRLLEWNNRPPATFARVNTLRTTAGQLVERWRSEGVDYDFKTWDWTGENLVFQLKSHPPLPTLGSFREGGFYVQDPSTLLAVRALGPQPGEQVLDSCAAPGGKTAFIAQLMENRGRVVAEDSSPARLKLLAENCTRLGVTCAETRGNEESSGHVDSRGPHHRVAGPAATEMFDRVLLDAPCSNTGVMRRRADLRWRLKPAELGRLRAMQLRLLGRAAAAVKRGGLLVYSTCSLEPEENAGLVKDFLLGRADFSLEYEHELLPFKDGVDGAFVARLKRTA